MRATAENTLKNLVKSYGLSDVVQYLEELCKENARKLNGESFLSKSWEEAAHKLAHADIPCNI